MTIDYEKFEPYTSTMYEAQKLAFFKALEGGKDLIITGRGGCGKSYLIEKLALATKNNTVVTATTGCAAVNVSGSTTHSVLALPLGIPTPQTMKKVSKKASMLFSKDHPVERIVIDECSMIGPAMFDAILQRRARFERMGKKGKIQLILIGDFTQLGSVTRAGQERDLIVEKYGTTHLLESELFQNHEFDIIELDQNKRAADKEFQLNLERVRFNHGLDKALPYFNAKQGKPKEGIPYITTTNATVEKINRAAFLKNPNPMQVYYAKVKGNFKDADTLMERELQLKEGLRVMTLANDQDGYYVNGSVGVVKTLLPEGVMVTLDNGLEVFVESYIAKNREYYTDDKGVLCQKETASFTQIPLRQCDAVTIFKAQGMTLEEAVVDMGNFVFAEGMTYVALSRLKTIDGLYLTRKLRPNDVSIHPSVVKFYRELWANKKK